ncbi:MAG: M43 family zinc metalloprotease [Vicingaceae bacterium]
MTNKTPLLSFLIVFLLYSFNATAQSLEECATDQKHRQLLQNDPEYAQRIQQNEQLIQHYLRSHDVSKSSGVLQIPLVIHVIHTGQSVGVGANISMNQVTSAIDTLNARYNNLQGSSVDTDIEFVLAQRDPNGNATNGVVRVDGSSVPLYATEGIGDGTTGANEIAVKNLSRWPNTQYYNVWVVTEIEDNNGGFGIQGYAYFPGANPEVDGTVIMNTCFGTNGTVNSWNNRNRTFVHELGHGLNLFHTFEGDNSGANCPPVSNGCGSGQGDCVSDTDPHIRAASNCPAGTNSCTGGSIDALSGNFMNYSSQSCAINYTSGQSARMRAALQALRPSLITSLGGVAPNSRIPASASCTPSTGSPSNSFGIALYDFELNNVRNLSRGILEEGDYVDHTHHQLIDLDEGATYTINLTLGSANNQDAEVYIDYNGDGDFADSGENIYSLDQTSGSPIVSNHSTSITIPSSGIQTDSILRLRVITDWYNNSITGPCYNPGFGQTEDYAVNIQSSSTPLVTTTSVTNESCPGLGDGTATVIASGGTIPYTYLWSNGSAASTATNLNAGNYSVTVSDAQGNTSIESVLINSPLSISVNISTTDESCLGNDGSATANASGGTLPYNFNWSSGSSGSSQLSGLSAGNYSLTLTDANGCDLISTFQINQATGCINPPQNLLSRYIQDTSVRLNWDIVQGATLYKVLWRRASESNWNRYVRNIPLGRLDLDTLQPNTKYFWAVRAYSPSEGWSDFSSLENFTTLSGPCEIPDGLVANAITDSRARLMWNVQANALKYRIRYRPQGGTWDKKLALGSRDRQFLQFLMPSTTYEWQIKSICTYGPSFGTTWSSMQSFTTDPSSSSQARVKGSEGEVLSEEGLSVFPNPNNGEFTITFDREVESTQIRISDISGRLVYEGVFSKQNRIDLNPQISESGVYLLFIQEGDQQTVKRLVIQK